MTSKAKTEIVDAFISTLNSALEADPAAILSLVRNRVPCNLTLAEHPTIVVDANPEAFGESYAVGMLGILNGVCGRLTGERIAIQLSDPVNSQGQRRIIGFTRYTPPDEEDE